MSRIREIHLWGDGSQFEEELCALSSYLKNRVHPMTIPAEGNLWEAIETDLIAPFARKIASARVFDLHKPFPTHGNDPLKGEIAYEERRIRGRNKSTGILYDGHFLSSILKTVPCLPKGSLAILPIVLTDRLVGSFDRFDRRYHARSVVFGYPDIISTTGVVEAPARPREYYLIKRRYQGSGMIPPEIEETLKSRYLDHGDPRIQEVLKGLVLQCLFYQATGEPFCEDPGCRLYNAHWQEELIYSQLTSADELCEKHEEQLRTFCQDYNQTGYSFFNHKRMG